jgi:type I restriction enzyme M protein
VRLPEGVFSPYADVATNLLFFDTTGPTNDIWYWEHQAPEGRRRYSKTQPLQYDEFAGCLDWWNNRKEGPHAWKVCASEIIQRDVGGIVVSANLDIKNPHAKDLVDHREPTEIVVSAIEKTRSLLSNLEDIKGLVSNGSLRGGWPLVPLSELLVRNEDWINLDPETDYRQITVRLWGNGVVLRATVKGADIAATSQIRVRAQQFIMSKIDARHGAFGIIPDSLDGAVVSQDFPVFTLREERIQPEFLSWMSKTEWFVNLCRKASEGSTNRVRLKEDRFLRQEIPLPPMPEQNRIIAALGKVADGQTASSEITSEVGHLIAAMLNQIS